MNLDYLRTFLVLAEVRSIQRASSILYMTPPAVKRILDNLEAQTGLVLFTRSHAGLEITESGTVFADYAFRILDLYNEALSLASSTSSKEGATIDAPWVSMKIKDPLYASAFSAFQEAHPEIDVVFRRVESFIGEHFDAINGFADIEHTRAVKNVLSHLPLCCIVAKNHPLASRESIAVEDLGDFPLLVPHAELIDLMDEHTRTFLKLQGGRVQSMGDDFRESEFFQWCARDQNVILVIGDWTHGGDSMYTDIIPIENAYFENCCFTQKHPSPATETYVRFLQDFYARAESSEEPAS